MLDSSDLNREGEHLRNHLDNVARMLAGVRRGDGSYTYAVVSMTCNAAENALEAALESVRRAKSECRLATYQRKITGPAFDPSRVAPRPSSALPAVGSFAAE